MRIGFAVAAAVIVLSTAGATVGIGFVQVQQIANVVHDYGHTEPFLRGTITPPPPGKPQTLLLVGSDRRYGDPRGDARSDTLMLVRLDPRQNATTVLSIPRDLRVTIPGHGIDKINAAYGEGGLDLTTRTVKDLLSTPGERFRVNHAIAINFKGFRDAVDVVHCVYVDVDRRYYHSNLGVPIGQRYAEINVQPGYQPL
jgi:LCP family protein required for cell wall assembly